MNAAIKLQETFLLCVKRGEGKWYRKAEYSTLNLARGACKNLHVAQEKVQALVLCVHSESEGKLKVAAMNTQPIKPFVDESLHREYLKPSNLWHKKLNNIPQFLGDINLGLGFPHVMLLAGNKYKRALIKDEVTLLFAAYIKAANKQQLIVINKEDIPFRVCGGSVFSYFGGSKSRYVLETIDTATRKLNRMLTKKESSCIKLQWQNLIRSKAVEHSYSNTVNGKEIGHTKHQIWDDNISHMKAKYLGDTATGITNANRFDCTESHDFSKIKKNLLAMLHSGRIKQPEYRERLAQAKAARDQAVANIRIKSDLLRNKHSNSDSVRVIHNAAGMTPAKPANQSKRYAMDGYR